MGEACYMDAEITPARSLSPRGLKVVMCITVLMALIPATVFSLLGVAHFVLPFLGLDVFGLWLAFFMMNRKVEAEHVRITAEAVEVRRGGKQVWSSPPAFTRIEPGETAVRLCLSRRRVLIARALSPPERRAFASALDEAMRRARSERYSNRTSP